MKHARRWIRCAGAAITAWVIVGAHATANAQDSTLAAIVREGDAAFDIFDNDNARLCYQRALALDSTDCNVLWKLARADVHHGMVAPEDERAVWFASGEQMARRSVALCPDSAEAHFFVAVAIGQMTKVVGNKRRIELSKEVKREAEKTLTLDPQHYGAMHVLGRWHYEVAGLSWLQRAAAKIIYGGAPGGSYEEAKAWFEGAIAVRPDMPLNHLWLGETLIKLHDYAGARKELETCLALADVMWDDAITRARALKTLGKIEGKK